MSEYRSIYELIAANITDGRLPDDFSLSKDEEVSNPNKLKWADGAMDGVSMYHMGFPKITDEHMQIIGDAFRLLDDPAQVMQKMAELFTDYSPVVFVDTIQQYLMDNSDKLDINKVVDLVFRCLSSKFRDMVKLGMIILELLSEPDEKIKDVVRTLGLCDEFTLFAVFNMLNWTNGNDEVFDLAKKVRGWGRIHLLRVWNPQMAK